MCTNGIKTNQLEQMIDQIDDHVALEYRWTHKLAYQADSAGFMAASEKLHATHSLLADVRAALDEAKSLLDSDARKAVSGNATAHLV